MSANLLASLFTAVISWLLGLFIFAQGKKKEVNVALAIFFAVLGGWCFGQFMGDTATAKDVVLFWTRLNIFFAVWLPPFYLYFISAFVGKLKDNRPYLILTAAISLVLTLFDLTGLFVADVIPRAGFAYYPVPGPLYAVFAVYIVAFFGFGFYELSLFIRQSEGVIKNQAKYIFAASLVGFLGGATLFFPVFGLNWPVVSNFALPLYLVITVYAIVKHKLLDINLVIREGLIYSLLTFFFAVFYALVIIIITRFFQGQIKFNEYLTMVAVVFVSVALFQPLKDRVQKWVDRLFFRGSYYYLKVIDDLSEENKKLFRGLLQADKLAALGTVAAGMAHEIKNPLASIKGLTQVLPENINDPEFIGKYQEIIPRQLDRINQIVENLLEFGSPKKLAMAAVEVPGVIEEVLRLVENQCRRAGIEIKKDFPPLPKILADREQLAQVFMNIILNAIQALPRGGEVKIKLREGRTVDEEKAVVAEIEDSGEGITEEKLLNIFDPFYTTKEGGTGMGLAVAYRIIKEHGGEIVAESQAGQGAKFTICLPIKPKR